MYDFDGFLVRGGYNFAEKRRAMEKVIVKKNESGNIEAVGLRGEVVGHETNSVKEADGVKATDGVKEAVGLCGGIDIQEIVKENTRRKKRLYSPYDQERGLACCGPRQSYYEPKWMPEPAYLPKSMLRDTDFAKVRSVEDWVRLRCRHDFEYWAIKCVVIKDKTSGRDIPFRLNNPQREVLGVLEKDRLAGKPLRMIILKARQWGGSTLVQLYMAWIQITQKKNWNSLICAHVKDTAATIRGMFTKVLDNYPEKYFEGDKKPGFKPFERTINTRVIEGRGCKVTLGSSENQDAIRGNDYAMAHLSEVAFWRSTPQASPADFIRAICGGINATPLTLIVLESTANGVGNYFHKEWLRARDGKSDKHAVFMPWYKIEIYRKPVGDVAKLWGEMDDYECDLWYNKGLTLEMIRWYHDKKREYQSREQMQSEYPTTDVEAFTTNEYNVFNHDDVEKLRAGCRAADYVGELVGNSRTGEAALRGIRFEESSKGNLRIWRKPDGTERGRRFVVGVDVGGRALTSDWSVITVIDRYGGEVGDKPEVVAQWRGHCDHDILAWMAVKIGRYWNNATVVFESNTFEAENIEGDPGQYILSQVKRHYPYLYHRRSDEGCGNKIGFHTNRSTKSMIISGLVATVRDGGYIERDSEMLNELITYQVKVNGSYGAQDGCHDDILMSRAIALHVARGLPVSTVVGDNAEERFYRKFG